MWPRESQDPTFVFPQFASSSSRLTSPASLLMVQFMRTFSCLTTALFMSTLVLNAGSIHDIAVKDIDGKDTTLKAYKGQVVLVVNVASKCGLTPQYKALEAVYEKYKDKKFTILGFPCN